MNLCGAFRLIRMFYVQE